MKKLYTLALGLLLGSVGMSAAEVTEIVPTVTPTSGSTFTFDEMSETTIKVDWNGEQLFYNQNSPYFNPDYGYLELDLNIDGETVDWIPAFIMPQADGSYSLEINVSYGWTWQWLPEDFGYNFSFDLYMPENSLFIGSEDGNVNATLSLSYNISENGSGGEGDGEGEGEGGGITSLDAYSEPENGSSLSYEEMGELCDSYYGGPWLIWGSGSPLYFNKESFDYNPYYEGGAIYVEVFVNGERTYLFADGIIYSEYYGLEIAYSELDIQLGDIWSYLYEDYGYNFELQLKIYEGSLFVGKNGGDVNGDIVLTYQIGESGVTNPYLSEPDFDVTDNVFYIYWDQEIQIANGASTVTAQMYYPGNIGTPLPVQMTGPVAWDPELADMTPDYPNNALMLDLTPYLIQYGNGKYQLMVTNEGVVTNEDGTQKNEPFRSPNFELVTDGITVAPDAVSYSDLGITLDYNYKVKINNDNTFGIIITNVKDANDSFSPTADDITIVDDTKVSINLMGYEFTQGETYEFNIPEGYFLVGAGCPSEAVEGKFTSESTGIGSFNSSIENTPVYNLQGVKVGNGIENLNNGIYIINGKKVVVRK